MNLVKDTVFTIPDWSSADPTWLPHFPLACWLIDTCRPRLVVEDRISGGDSYFAFCQAAAGLGIETECRALADSRTWEAQIGSDLRRGILEHNRERYAPFSAILESSSGEGWTLFEDRSVDILHLDGLGLEASAGEVFSSWLPRFSRRGLLLLHGILDPESGSGTAALWRELRERYPAFSFPGGKGLGVMGIGPEQPEELEELWGRVPGQDPDEIRKFFGFLGRGLPSRSRVGSGRETGLSVRLIQASEGPEYEDPGPGGWKSVRLSGGRTRLEFDLDSTRKSGFFSFNPAREPCTIRIDRVWARSRAGAGVDLAPSGDNAGCRESGFLVFFNRDPEIRFACQPGHYEKIWLEVRYLDLGINSFLAAPGSGQDDQPDCSNLLEERERMAGYLEAARGESHRQRWKYQLLLQERDRLEATVKYYQDRLWIVEHSTTWSLARAFLDRLDRLKGLVGSGTKGGPTPGRDRYEKFRPDWRSLSVPVLVDLSGAGHQEALAGVLNQVFTRGEVLVAVSPEPGGKTLREMEDFFSKQLPGRRVKLFDSTGRPITEVFSEMAETVEGGGSLILVVEYPGPVARETDATLEGITGRELKNAVKLLAEDSGIGLIPLAGCSGTGANLFWADREYLRKQAARRGADNGGGNGKYRFFRSRSRLALERFLGEGGFLSFPNLPGPALSILIVLYNQADLTYECLDSVRQSRFRDFELILFNNDSSGETSRLLYRVEGALIINSDENIGFLKAVNLAARRARGEFLLLLNNDTTLEPDALGRAVAAMRAAKDIGALGGRLVMPDGTLQEAGSIIWSDGSCLGYGRGADPDSAEFQFCRDVDYCSGAFLLLRRKQFLELGGFDEDYAPAYYEDTDYCLRLWQAGHRVVYEPSVRIRHWESASVDSWKSACEQMTGNSTVFYEKHREFLERNQLPPDEGNVLEARSVDRKGYKILLMDDRVPFPEYGAGSPRTEAILGAMVASGFRVTYFSFEVNASPDWDLIRERLPRGVEFILDRGSHHLPEFLREREGYFDLIWICRPHNQEMLQEALERLSGTSYRRPPIIYDAEAVYSGREVMRAEVKGAQLDSSARDGMLVKEIGLASLSEGIVAVTGKEAGFFRRHLPDIPVAVLGHTVSRSYTCGRDFSRRGHFLFTGRLEGIESPNVDSIRWFLSGILPAIREDLGERVKLIAAGLYEEESFRDQDLRGVCFRGSRESLAPYFRNCRVFVAPTRYAAGLPLKVLEAAAGGIPIVCTPVLASQLGWEHEKEALVAATAGDFAGQCLRLYRDRELWESLREEARARVLKEYSSETFRDRIVSIVQGVPPDRPR